MIRIGIGGWDYAPWRGTFYPPELKKREELAWASRQLTAIEINATFYRTQSRDSFARWAGEVPPTFRFALKGPRAVSQRADLQAVSEGLAWFFGSGVEALGLRLGPVLWQLAPHKRFDADELRAFLALLPRRLGRLALRHAVETRHPSFNDPLALALFRAAKVAPVLLDGAGTDAVTDPAQRTIYVRLKGSAMEEAAGYAPAALDSWADALRALEQGRLPAGIGALPVTRPPGTPRDVYAFVIGGAKVRAPQAALALQARLGLRGAP